MSESSSDNEQKDKLNQNDLREDDELNEHEQNNNNHEKEATLSKDSESNEEVEEESNDIDNNSKSDNEEDEGGEISEEEILKDQLENVDFKSLLIAKAKLSYEAKKKNKENMHKKKFNKNTILTKMDKINKDKKKAEPKEFSALLKPQYQFKNRDKMKNNSSLLGKKFLRDPRFDDLSGNLNETQFKKNFEFVHDMAKDYVNKLKKVKNSKKYKKKLTEQQYELLKKQNNFVKSWMNQQKQSQIKSDIKKEINKENKERYSKGQKPIYINNNKINKFLKNDKLDK